MYWYLLERNMLLSHTWGQEAKAGSQQEGDREPEPRSVSTSPPPIPFLQQANYTLQSSSTVIATTVDLYSCVLSHSVFRNSKYFLNCLRGREVLWWAHLSLYAKLFDSTVISLSDHVPLPKGRRWNARKKKVAYDHHIIKIPTVFFYHTWFMREECLKSWILIQKLSKSKALGSLVLWVCLWGGNHQSSVCH